MRKLIVAGIITVLAMIGWISYLKYDTHRFIKELPSISSEQQPKDTMKDPSVPVPDSITESTTGNEKGSAGTSEDVAHPDKLRSNTVTGGNVLESGQTSDGTKLSPESDETKLSPEIVALYTDFQPLYDEYVKVGLECMQVSTKMHEIARREKEITEKLNATSDPETKQELRVERKQLQTWIDANYSTYNALNDETDTRIDAMRTLVESRGFSYRHFDWNVFFTWRGESSK